MQTYIILSRFRDEALQTMKDAPQRSQTGRAAAEAMGCKIVGSYLTLGRFDRVLVIEAPDDVTVAKVAMGLGTKGHEETETLRAFNPAEVGEIVRSVS
jgi:uncharacterized protein with GYD domain